MLEWDRNFYRPEVGKAPQKLRERMNEPNSGHKTDKTSYANGQFVGDKDGVVSYSHSGGWLGTSTYYGRFPELHLSLVVMCNDASLDVGILVKQTLAVLLPR